jgi:hypothetical protein
MRLYNKAVTKANSMFQKNAVSGYRIIIANPNTVMKAAKLLAPGMNAAMLPKNRTIRIAAIKAKIACIDEDIKVNGAALICLISLISTIFSPPFTIDVILFLKGHILNFAFKGDKNSQNRILID